MIALHVQATVDAMQRSRSPEGHLSVSAKSLILEIFDPKYVLDILE